MRQGRARRRWRWGLPIVLALLGWTPLWSQRYAPVNGVTRAAELTPSATHRSAAPQASDTTTNAQPYVALTATAQAGSASGRVDLLPVASPFGVAVTADGSQRYRTRFVVRGLPAASSLGPYSVYVAWAASWFLEDAQRLGVVMMDGGELAEVRRSKFRILITAETSPEVRRPTGPVVLRGISPSGRLSPNESCNLDFLGPC
jgi:hypothetical protein